MSFVSGEAGRHVPNFAVFHHNNHSFLEKTKKIRLAQTKTTL